MIDPKDIPGFFADASTLNPEDYIRIDYTFETSAPPKEAIAALCAEQSTAQWKRDDRIEDLRPRFGAKATRFEIRSQSGEKSTVSVTVAHPIVNFGPRIPNLLSAIAGEGPLYCPGIHTIRITDLHLPNSFIRQFEGPQFGLEGVRKILNVYGRPIFIGVVKPNIGLPPKDFAELAFESWMGGLDIAKDDEMLAECDYSSIADRMKLAGAARAQAESETGTPKMLVANITDEVDLIETRYREARDNGANTVMVNGMFAGLSSLRALRKKSELPVMGHFTGMALYDRIPNFGIEGVVLIKLQRLAGCDLIVMPGFGPRMHQTDETVLKNVKACLEPMGSLKPALPVPGGSDSAKTLPKIFEKIGHPDFGFIAGRGVFGYPGGPRAGAASLHEAWKQISS